MKLDRRRRRIYRYGMAIEKKDIEITPYRSRGPGGQRKNKKETAIRIVHLPTGIVARGTESRSQAQNKDIALQRLAEKLSRREQKKKPRIPTRKSVGIREREREWKRHRARKKTSRREKGED